MSAYEISIVSIIGINVILAVSLNLISGFCGQSVSATGPFSGRAHAAALAMVGTGSVPLAIVAALVTGSLLGLIVGFASLRVRTDFLAVTTIGVNFLFVGFVRKQAWLGGEMGISGIPGTGLGASGNLAMILLFAALTIALSIYISRSWMGFAFRAVGEDEGTRPRSASMSAPTSSPLSASERRSRALPAASTPSSRSSSPPMLSTSSCR